MVSVSAMLVDTLTSLNKPSASLNKPSASLPMRLTQTGNKITT